MKSRFKKTTALFFALVLTMCIGVSALAASRSGTLEGYAWRVSLNGSSSRVTASTSYDKSNSNRSVTVSGTYIGPDFLGERTVSNGNGYYIGSVSASVSTSQKNRFIKANSSHEINTISTSLNETFR